MNLRRKKCRDVCLAKLAGKGRYKDAIYFCQIRGPQISNIDAVLSNSDWTAEGRSTQHPTGVTRDTS